MPVLPTQGSPPPGLLESHVQLPQDGTGKMLRAFPVCTYEQQADGTFAEQTAYQQVLMLADANGNLLGVKAAPIYVTDEDQRSVLEEIRDELRLIREHLEER